MIDHSYRLDEAVDAHSLMLRVQAGESAAFDELFARYRSFVFYVVYRIIRDAKLAEDITQVVFLKVWCSRLAFREGSLVAWISRLSRNCALDEVRRRRTFYGLSDIAVDGMGPFECVVAAMEARKLMEALAGLRPTQRSLIELSFFMELTHLQIAARTGIPLGTVKTRIRAGLRVLRRTLYDGVATRTEVSYSTHPRVPDTQQMQHPLTCSKL